MPETAQSIATCNLYAGWPDEFVKDIAQKIAQPIFVQINAQLLP
jgi:hypothetical protein